MLTGNAIVRRNNEVEFTLGADDGALLFFRTGRCCRLNGIGSAIWDCVSEPVCIRDLCLTLSGEYDDEGDIDRDVLVEVENLAASGLVTIQS